MSYNPPNTPWSQVPYSPRPPFRAGYDGPPRRRTMSFGQQPPVGSPSQDGSPRSPSGAVFADIGYQPLQEGRIGPGGAWPGDFQAPVPPRAPSQAGSSRAPSPFRPNTTGPPLHRAPSAPPGMPVSAESEEYKRKREEIKMEIEEITNPRYLFYSCEPSEVAGSYWSKELKKWVKPCQWEAKTKRPDRFNPARDHHNLRKLYDEEKSGDYVISVTEKDEITALRSLLAELRKIVQRKARAQELIEAREEYARLLGARANE